MPPVNVTLEPSEGPTIRNPTREQIRAMLVRIGAGLDHCILELGSQTDFLQAAGATNRLLVQYRDASGMFESARSDLDVDTVERIFADAMAGGTGWKTQIVFTAVQGASEGTGSPRASAAASPQRSPEQVLLDAVKRKAKEGINKLVKGGLRGLFGGKL